MTEFSECNSISLESYYWFPDFLAEHQWKSANWIPMGNEHDFSTTILNKYSIKTLHISCVVFYFTKSQSLHPHLTAEHDGWQGTGEIGIIHMIALSLHQIWAVWELFWIKRLVYCENEYCVQHTLCVSSSSTPNLASRILSWLAVLSACTGWYV